METARRTVLASMIVAAVVAGGSAQDVSFERLTTAADAPADWLTYSGT